MNVQLLIVSLARFRFLRELSRRWRGSLAQGGRGLKERISSGDDALFASHRALATDAPGEANLNVASLALAAFGALLKAGVPSVDALVLVRFFVVGPGQERSAWLMGL